MTNRILLQHRQSRMYFKAGNHWTLEINEAMDFRKILLALDFAVALRPSQVDLLMSFDDPRYDVRLNLGLHALATSTW